MVKHSKIESAIFELTGQKPVFDQNKEGYTMTLGVLKPFTLSYRNNPKYSIGEHRYALLITLLESIINLMQDPLGFEEWVTKNSEQ